MSVPAKTIRRFTAQQKAEAVELGLQEGLCCNVMAQRLGLPSSSLARWVSQTRITIAQAGPKDQGLVSSEEWTALNPTPFGVENSGGTRIVQAEASARCPRSLSHVAPAGT